MNITYRFRDCAKLFRRPTLFNELFYTPSIECFHSRGLHLCKCFGTKEIICIRKEFISNGTGLGHQHGRRFIVLGHQYGRRDVMWKHSIAGYRNTGSVHGNFSVLLAKFVKRGRFEKKVFWGTRFGCIWSGKALRGNAYFSSLIAFDEGERFLFVYRTRSSNRSVCHAISGFGRHLGPAWHTLPRSHVFSFSRPGAGIYFVTLVRRWNFGDFLFTTGLFMVFLAVFN